MTAATATDQQQGGGVRLADLAGDFGDDPAEVASAPAHEDARTHAREHTNASTAAPAREQNTDDQPEPEQDTVSEGDEAEPRPRRRPRRRPRSAREHASKVQERITASDGLAGLTLPTLAEAIAEQEEAIQQFRTLWWRIPRSLQAVSYVLLLISAIALLRLLARTRYLLTALVLGGGLYWAANLWGVGL